MVRFRVLALVVGLFPAIGCRGPESGFQVLSADVPLHLEDHLDAARVAIQGTPEDPNANGPLFGIANKDWGRFTRRILYANAPGKIEYRIRIPYNGRLDVGMGVLDPSKPVTFRISARVEETGSVVLFETLCGMQRPWLQSAVDLSPLAGKTVILSLETEAGQLGNVAFWASPTISGRRAVGRPNIILYIIDGAAADRMSVYGYQRHTTPCLEQIAAEGAVFENAHSNSSITKVSVPSFMTSLHGSVLGGHRAGSDPLPGGAVTMAERLHKAGYTTEVLTSNPYCGRLSSLDRGVDIMMDTQWKRDKLTSEDLHEEFWRLRQLVPGTPFWVHFQPTDIHRPWDPHLPFAGLFAGLDDRETFKEMLDEVDWDSTLSYEENIEKSQFDHDRFYRIAGDLYDECMAYQDSTIGRLAERLKQNGEWERTLFIVAADHSREGAGFPLHDHDSPPWEPPLLAAHKSHIPLIFIWPGKIAPGQRFSQPVSMIDVLPTILDLAGQPQAEFAQGRSLAPLLLGWPGWRPRPVVFDEFRVEGNLLVGSIEVVDGRWGASLRIDPRPDSLKSPRERRRPAPLLIFDVERDPYACRSIHLERPDLVAKYSKMLSRLWVEHRKLAVKFPRESANPMMPSQIETLRSLGYLR